MRLRLSLKVIYRRRPSYQLGIKVSCARSGRSRIFAVFVVYACASRRLFKALLDKLSLHIVSAASLMMLKFPSCTIMRK